MRFKNLEEKPERKNPKRTISTSGGLELLQMISKLDSRRYVSEEAEPWMGVDTRWCASKDAESLREWIWGVPHRLEKGTSASKDAGPTRGVDWEIPRWLEREQSIPCKGVETSPELTCFKTAIRNEPKQTISPSSGFGLLQESSFLDPELRT